MKLTLLSILFLILSGCDVPGKKESSGKSRSIATKQINRPAYELSYPSNWVIDTSDSDYDIDGNFSIDPPVADATSVFFIFNVAVDEESQVSSQLKVHLEKVIKNGSVSYFTNWGHYSGRGALIKGKVLGIWKGAVRIFCHSGDSCSFLNVSEYLDSDTGTVSPGFNLIESSFRLKQ